MSLSYERSINQGIHMRWGKIAQEITNLLYDSQFGRESFNRANLVINLLYGG